MKITQQQRNLLATKLEQERVDAELNELLYSDEEFDSMSNEEQRLTISQLNSLLNHAFKQR